MKWSALLERAVSLPTVTQMSPPVPLGSMRIIKTMAKKEGDGSTRGWPGIARAAICTLNDLQNSLASPL